MTVDAATAARRKPVACAARAAFTALTVGPRQAHNDRNGLRRVSSAIANLYAEHRHRPEQSTRRAQHRRPEAAVLSAEHFDACRRLRRDGLKGAEPRLEQLCGEGGADAVNLPQPRDRIVVPAEAGDERAAEDETRIKGVAVALLLCEVLDQCAEDAAAALGKREVCRVELAWWVPAGAELDEQRGLHRRSLDLRMTTTRGHHRQHACCHEAARQARASGSRLRARGESARREREARARGVAEARA